MVAKIREWIYPSPDTPGTLRLSFAGTYIGVIGALVLYINIVSPCADLVSPARRWLMLALILLLPTVERYELRKAAQQRGSRRLSVGLLLVRMALVQGVVVLDCTGLAVLLYPIIPFTGSFALSPRIGAWLGLFYWLLVVAQTWFLENLSPLTDIDSLTIIFVFTLTLIFMQSIAHIIARDEQGRQQTRQLLDKLAASHRDLQSYAAQVADLAAAEERNRLAREIHDSIGHHLMAINIQLEKALAYRERNPQEADQAILDAKLSAQQALKDVRHSVSALRSTSEVFSLKQALADLADRMTTNALSIDLKVEGDESGYARTVLIALYRAAQEGLTNVQKHAQAQHVVLDVRLGDEEACLNIRDDGDGFDTNSLVELASSPYESFGLQGLRERLNLMQGHMTVISSPQEGTELTITVPKNPAQLPLVGVA